MSDVASRSSSHLDLLYLLMYAWCWLVALDTDNSRTFSPELEVEEGVGSSPETRNIDSLSCYTRARLPVCATRHETSPSSSDPSLNGHLHYPNDIDKSLSEAARDKIRKYRTDSNNNPPSTVSLRLSGMSGLSSLLRKTGFKLIFIGNSYSDTSVCERAQCFTSSCSTKCKMLL